MLRALKMHTALHTCMALKALKSMRALQNTLSFLYFSFEVFWLAYYLCQLLSTFIGEDWPLNAFDECPLEQGSHLMIYKSDQIKILLQSC